MKSILVIAIGAIGVGASWWLLVEPPTAQMATSNVGSKIEPDAKADISVRRQARRASSQSTSELSQDIASFELSRSNQRPTYENQKRAYKTIIDEQTALTSLRTGHTGRQQSAQAPSQNVKKTNPYLAYSLPELSKALDAKIVKVNGRLMLEKNRRLISDQEARHILYKLSKQRSNS